MDEPVISITPAFKGAMVPSDLLSSSGAITFVTDRASIGEGGFIFQVKCDGFIFALSFQNQSIVLQRNETVSVFDLKSFINKYDRIRVFAMWSTSALGFECGVDEDRKHISVPTKPIAPPASIIRWARKKMLLPVESYNSEEVFREKVYSCLITINQKIKEADAYKSFWNISYEGNTITGRQPKKEVDIQPLIHCFLSDQMLLANIEIIPEYPSGVGSLDFLFLGQVKDHGLCKLCAEFKLAHSNDLEHGLLEQLPDYMAVSNATYGAYCVLNFKGGWFEKPALPDNKALDIYLPLVQRSSSNPVQKNIRTFIFDLAKPKTASNK